VAPGPVNARPQLPTDDRAPARRPSALQRVRGPSVIALLVQLVQIGLGVATIPLLVSSLGAERFSMLSILWAIPSLVPLIDLGLPRAVAILLIGDRDPPADRQGVVLGAALLTQVVILFVLGAAWLLLDPGHAVLGRVGAMSGEPASTERTAHLFLLAAGALSLFNIPAAFLQATGRLYALLLITSLAGLAVSAVPLLAFWASLSLNGIAVATLVLRALALVVAFGIVFRSRWGWHVARDLRAAAATARQLLGTGAKALLYFAVSPLLVFGDRYLVPYVEGSVAFTSHLIAVDVGMKFLIVPGVIAQYSLKSIADAAGGGRRFDQAAREYLSMMRWWYLLPVIVAIVFSKELLNVWLGPARRSIVSPASLQMVLVAISSVAVSSFLVQVALAADAVQRLSALVAVELVVCPILLYLALHFRPLGLELSLVLGFAWSLRVVAETAGMRHLFRDRFDTPVLGKSVFVFTILPCLAAVAAGAVDSFGPPGTPWIKGSLLLCFLAWAVFSAAGKGAACDEAH
jgi:O-antigen/teichoic acid export membrane protein